MEVDRDRLREALAHWKRLEREHADGIDFVKGMRLLAGADFGGGDGGLEPVAEWSQVTAGGWLRDTLSALRDPQGRPGCEPGLDLRATLRPYQEAGVRWLWFLSRLGLGACLADDMGLGKTVQVIDLLLRLRAGDAAAKLAGGGKRATGPRPPSLLVVPASLVGNWKQELARFAPQLDALFVHHSEAPAEALERLAR